MWREIAKLFRSENLLKEAWGDCFDMLDIANEMFLEAVRVLRDTDSVDVSQEVVAKDALVDAFERDVRKKVLTHSAVRNADIPASMVLVTIVIDIERIGDYIKNCVNLARTHAARLSGGAYEESLVRIEEEVKRNFVDTRACLRSDDVETARRLLGEYGWVKALCDDILNSLIRARDTVLSPSEAVALALYVRWLRRINSHLHNLNTAVANPFDLIGFKPGA